MLDPSAIKQDFSILNQEFKGKPLAFLDNASSTQKPKQVIEALSDYYSSFNANIHRGVYNLSEKATDAYEQSRQAVANFINANTAEEVIFTRSTTESINLLAYSWGEANIKEGDEIIVSEYEHHSNFIPWQQLCLRKKATLKLIPVKKDLSLDLEAYKTLLSEKTKLVAITGTSNVTGYKTPLKTIVTEARKTPALVLVDAAQTAAHEKIDVQNLDCDFLAFSAHKMLGPTGVGVLYGKKQHLETMPPFNFGGSMIKEVQTLNSTWADIPAKLEAGTPNIAGVVAFKSALEHLEAIGLENIQQHEKELTESAIEIFSQHTEVTLLTPPKEYRTGIISLNIKGSHPHDISTIFNEHNIAIRAGHHCCQPLMNALKVNSTARISFYLYNTLEDVKRAETALQNVIQIFS